MTFGLIKNHSFASLSTWLKGNTGHIRDIGKFLHSIEQKRTSKEFTY